MKCLNCGCASERYLCPDCTTADILSKIFFEIRSYKPETCENPYLAEFAAGLTKKYEERDILPEILGYFDFETAEYFYCQYYRMHRDDRFEDAAITYLNRHDLLEIRSQRILYALLDSYIPNNFIKPKPWCEMISASDDFCCDLYLTAAKYYAMIGEYDLSDATADKADEIARGDEDHSRLLYFSPEGILIRLEKQKADTLRYRTKKPYWPLTEERRRAVAMFYDEKGIKYPRIENKPMKVPENEFAPINECFDEMLTDYCTFWCSEVFSVSGIKCIYQIAAVKVRDNQVVDTFETLVRPWDARIEARKSAAKEIGVPVEALESAEDVDLVMQKFFAFVGDNILVSTGALGNQAKLISRAARYAGMKEIRNSFFDLLDLAADVSEEFDLANNTRDYLLTHLDIPEGTNALEKAQVNKILYDALMRYGD